MNASSPSGISYCAWCNGARGEMKQVHIRIPQGIRLQREWVELAVHEGHERPLRRFLARLRRDARRFLVLLIGVVILPMGLTAVAHLVGIDESVRTQWQDVVTGIMSLGVGMIFLAFPFATPLTVEGLGVRTSVRLVRGIGVVASAVGIWQIVVTLL